MPSRVSHERWLDLIGRTVDRTCGDCVMLIVTLPGTAACLLKHEQPVLLGLRSRWPASGRYQKRGETGQALTEYALILAFVAIVAIVALLFLGNQISGILSQLGASLSTP